MGKVRKDIFIAMTTRGRIDNQKTLQRLHPEVLKCVSIFCHPGELSQHKKNWGDKVRSIEEYDPEAKNLAEIREWLAFNAPGDKIIFMDDNIDFSIRRTRDDSLLTLIKKNYTDEEIREYQTEMFNWMWDNLDEEKIAITGISFRGFNLCSDPEIEMNKRFFALWGLNVKKYYSQVNQPIYMSDWPIKEDFATGIAMRRMGYNIIVNNKFAFGKPSGANCKGGCSTYRNVELMNSESKRMAEAFPDIVKLKVKKSKNWNGDFKGKEAIDVVIYWSKIKPLD